MSKSLFFLILLLVPALSRSYRAAIAAHSPISASTPSETIQQNLGLYEQHAVIAKSRGAQILLFPEFGLSATNIFHDRNLALPYGESIPQGAHLNFCDNTTYPPALTALSCMAKKYGMVVVANVYDKQPCTSGCRADNQYLFNAEVAFDETGNLIAKYYKTHIWFTDVFDTPKVPTLTNFTTSFGVNFGLMICFDIAFGSPGPKLVSKGITHFPYSVAQGIVGPLVVKTWSYLNSATVLSGNQGSHVGAYQRGVTLDGTKYPLAGSEDSVFITDVPF